MRKLSYIFVLVGLTTQAQPGLYNAGNIRIHQDGQLGFHTNFINNSAFDQNLGLAGFYGTQGLAVSGAFVPVFFDVEIANDGHVTLDLGMDVLNNTNFVVGDFITPKDQPDIYYNFIQDAFFVGDGPPSKIDGYAAITNKQEFTFPVGVGTVYRPLTIESSGVNAFAKCAYFNENPDNPSTFPSFDINLKPREIARISPFEFWRLEGSLSSTVTVSWDANSNMGQLVSDPSEITLVGWNKVAGRWLDLGVGAVVGDLSNGIITSNAFVPDDYEVITFGSLAEPTEILTLDNYLLTPNGDGINDVLVIEGMELSPNNSIKIYDRNGLKVFDMVNYTNQFAGISNVDNFVINREQGLPEGIYFYVVSLDDLGLNYQGFLYLERLD